MDRGRDSTCCRTADPEIVESEPDVFECETCDFREHVEGLDEDNADAWRCYAKLTAHRWVLDIEAGAWWINRLLGDRDDDECDDLMARVSIIYDTLHPPKAPRHGA